MGLKLHYAEIFAESILFFSYDSFRGKTATDVGSAQGGAGGGRFEGAGGNLVWNLVWSLVE